MAGGRIQTWWRARSIDQISYPASPASVDVSAAKAQWDKLASGLTCVPRNLKKHEMIDLGNGKQGMKTGRGILQAPAKEKQQDDEDDEADEADQEDPAQEDQEDEVDEGQGNDNDQD